MSNLALSAISDRDLDARLRSLRCRERETTLAILFHLNEVERRKLHLRLGYSSMFVYCTQHLRYSESAAGRRVQAARCVARFPQVAELLQTGDVNLSTLGLIAGLLTEDNAEQFLGRIRGKSQREVEKIVSEFLPPVPLRDRVRHVTVPAPIVPCPPPVVGSMPAPEAVAPGSLFVNPVSNSRSGSEGSPNVAKRDIAQTVSKLHIQFLADEEFMKKFNEACALLSHKFAKPSFEAVFGALLDEFLMRHSPKRRQERREARSVKSTDPAPGRASMASRPTIPASTRDAVHVRDRGRCSFVGAHGRRCGESRGLHIDHIVPKARYGTNEAKNLRRLCAQHNQLEAERILGADLMNQYKRPGGST